MSRGLINPDVQSDAIARNGSRKKKVQHLEYRPPVTPSLREFCIHRHRDKLNQISAFVFLTNYPHRFRFVVGTANKFNFFLNVFTAVCFCGESSLLVPLERGAIFYFGMFEIRALGGPRLIELVTADTSGAWNEITRVIGQRVMTFSNECALDCWPARLLYQPLQALHCTQPKRACFTS